MFSWGFYYNKCCELELPWPCPLSVPLNLWLPLLPTLCSSLSSSTTFVSPAPWSGPIREKHNTVQGHVFECAIPNRDLSCLGREFTGSGVCFLCLILKGNPRYKNCAALRPRPPTLLQLCTFPSLRLLVLTGSWRTPPPSFWISVRATPEPGVVCLLQ